MWFLYYVCSRQRNDKSSQHLQSFHTAEAFRRPVSVATTRVCACNTHTRFVSKSTNPHVQFHEVKSFSDRAESRSKPGSSTFLSVACVNREITRTDVFANPKDSLSLSLSSVHVTMTFHYFGQWSTGGVTILCSNVLVCSAEQNWGPFSSCW